MRSEIREESGFIYKTVSASEYTFRVINENVEGYRLWLDGVGIYTPDTNLKFYDGIITFEQKIIGRVRYGNTKDLVARLSRLKFNKYGIDSNPDNFVGYEKPYFVDFFPFLVKDDRLLDEEFDYSSQEAIERYFRLGNVLSFYSIRLFRTEAPQAIESLHHAKKTLLHEYKYIHPREKIRMLLALRLYEQNNMQEYSRAYRVTRYAKSISEDHDIELRDRIEKI